MGGFKNRSIAEAYRKMNEMSAEAVTANNELKKTISCLSETQIIARIRRGNKFINNDLEDHFDWMEPSDLKKCSRILDRIGNLKIKSAINLIGSLDSEPAVIAYEAIEVAFGSRIAELIDIVSTYS